MPATAAMPGELITSLEELRAVLTRIDATQAEEIERVASRYAFRVPRFYVENVLRNDPADPLWPLAIPGQVELQDAGEERWDAFQLPRRVVDHPRWIQKYRYEALLRVTDFCSGLCRYCYLKNRDVAPGCISHGEIDEIFDAAEQSPQRGELRELILSGGDPLAAPGAILGHFAERIDRLNRTVPRRITVCIHTRDPVWYPGRILQSAALREALRRLAPSSYILHVVHPREVTPQLHAALQLLSELGGARRPLMLTQHPLFRGVNADAAIITDLYDRLDSGPVVVKPYYLIHPFPDGTLPQHRLTLRESQRILRELAAAPGTRVPLLTVPTPMGKCVIGPYDPLPDEGGYHLLHTKDGVPVRYSTGRVYNPHESRLSIPLAPTINGVEFGYTVRDRV
jgi:L-lysine 2,3-aminomutase